MGVRKYKGQARRHQRPTKCSRPNKGGERYSKTSQVALEIRKNQEVMISYSRHPVNQLF